MDTSNNATGIEKVWAEIIDRECDPAPEQTLRGLSDSTGPAQTSLVWGSVFASADPAVTGRESLTGTSSASFLGDLAIRTSRVAMKADDDAERHLACVDGDDFLILNELGRGGMGVVYNAVQGSLDRNVAVKMISPAMAGNEGARRKMVSEALIIGELDHPNIIPIYDLGRTEQNNLFYAMKTVKGTPWSSRLPSNSQRANLGILMRVCDAVAFAHAKGIIHRDLKPSNVMLGDYGEVLLMDWGLAVSLAPSPKAQHLTLLNAVAGTPAYMAPEMALGETGKIDTRSDIYLLGAILYEIVTGTRPHSGENSRACLRAAAANDIVRTGISDDLLTIALIAMATDPESRYATVKDFQNAISEMETHRESLTMTSSAEAHLLSAEAGGGYADYAQAVYAFREAGRLWRHNPRAMAGETNARMKYAACAFSKGDYDLALETLDGLEDEESAALIAKTRRARALLHLRQRRFRLLTYAAVGLTAAVVIILAASTVIVSDRVRREQEARREARQALFETNAARERERQASVEREDALRREKAALLRARDAQEKRLEALARAESDRLRKEEAERARLTMADEMSRKGQLEDASWWAFDADAARERQGRAAGPDAPPSLDMAIGPASMTFSLIPAGEFVMGSAPTSPWHAPDEYLHRVEISRPFYLGRTEVTRAQWRAVVGMESEEDLMPAYNPLFRDEREEDYRNYQLDVWGWRTRPLKTGEGDLPATGVTAREIEERFLPAVSAHTPPGWTADLPSEAQWEYAARSGSPGPYFGYDPAGPLSVPGWTRENSRLRLYPPGGHPANAWNLVDMHGNAGEIVRDLYAPDYYLTSPRSDPVNMQSGDFRVYRGGNVLHAGSDSLSASRHRIHPNNRYAQIGFRLALLPVDSSGALPEAATHE